MKKWTLAIALAAVLATAPTALATPLAPNSSVGSIATIDLAGSPSNWDFVDGTGVVTVSSATYQLKMQTQVFRDLDTGFLDFLYTVENVQFDAPDFNVHQLTMSSFPNGSTADVYFVKDSGIEPLLGAARDLSGNIAFNFDPDHLLKPGDTTSVLIRTRDTSYREGEFSAVGDETVTTASFAPEHTASVVPLPGSLVLCASGALSLVGGLFRRVRKGLTLTA